MSITENADTKHAAVTVFALEPGTRPDDSDFVVRHGKVFEAGEYPDKEITVTEADLTKMAEDFKPVNNSLEHTPTVLDGKLGRLHNVRVVGRELLGSMLIPQWLDDAIGRDKPLPVSLELDRETKNIVGNALVLHPRVADAQLIAAFNAAKTGTGGMDMPIPETQKSFWEKLISRFSGGLPEGITEANADKVILSAEAESGAGAETEAKTEAGNFSKSDAKTPAAVPVEGDDGAKTPETATAAVEGFSEADRQQLTALRAKHLRAEAEAFFNDALAQHRVYPAERDALIAQFTQAALDDNAGSVCFSTDGALIEGPRLKTLKLSVESRPTYALTQETISGLSPDTMVLMSTGGNGSAPGADRMAELRRKAGLKEAK